MKHVLKQLKDVAGQPVTLSSDPTGEILEIDPDRNVKYVFILDVGDWSPDRTIGYMKTVMGQMEEFLGKDRVLIAPRKPGQDGIKLYEVQPFVDWCDECKREKCECDLLRSNRGL